MTLRRPGSGPAVERHIRAKRPRNESVGPGVPYPAVTLEGAEEKGWPLEKKDHERGLGGGDSLGDELVEAFAARERL